MLLSSIASIIFQITYKTQNLVKCQGTLRIKTQSIRKVDRKIYQTKHLSVHCLANRFSSYYVSKLYEIYVTFAISLSFYSLTTILPLSPITTLNKDLLIYEVV